MTISQSTNRRRLVRTVVCPHCWFEFSPESFLWIDASAPSEYDRVLQQETHPRFLPSRFDFEGFALDAQGRQCRDLACPRCHTVAPSSLLVARPLFISLVGGPASGKTYFLASAIRLLRRSLPERFFIDMVDSDLALNDALREGERAFDASSENTVDLGTYRAVRDEVHTLRINDDDFLRLSPLMFALSPRSEHPKFERAHKIARTMCVYDAGGANYLPEESAEFDAMAKTRCLGKSQALLFFFDPTQCGAMRGELLKTSRDPQLEDYIARRRSMVAQESVLKETARRVRKYRGLRESEKSDALLIVLVSKFDVCRSLLDEAADLSSPISRGIYEGGERGLLRSDKILRVSEYIRAMLSRFSPEIVQTAESSFNEVVYLPTSATGCSPEVDSESRELFFHSDAIAPLWVEEPFYYLLSKTVRGALPAKE